MTVSLDEFLRRFLLHLLPKGFVRIRHFGFLANRRRSTLLPPRSNSVLHRSWSRLPHEADENSSELTLRERGIRMAEWLSSSEWLT